MDSYRVEKHAMWRNILPDGHAELDPVPPAGEGGRPEAETNPLSRIIDDFNDLFGSSEWKDDERIHEMVTETIPARVAEDETFHHARRNSDRENTRIQDDQALQRVMTAIMRDDTELFKQFIDNADLRRWLGDREFRLAYATGLEQWTVTARFVSPHPPSCSGPRSAPSSHQTIT